MTLREIRKFLFGAVETREEKGGLRAFPIPEKIRRIWGEKADWLETHASFPTGVRLDLHTDAPTVCFTLSGGTFTVALDGLFAGKWEAMEKTTFSLSLPAGDHRVTMWYPLHENGIVHDLTLPEGYSATPHAYDCSFLFLGDSITQGFCAEHDTCAFALQVSAACNADCLIQGVGGAYFNPDAFEKPEYFDPHRVIVAFGTNDPTWGFDGETLRKQTGDYLEKLVAAFGPAKVLCILPIWRSENSLKEEIRGFYGECMAMIRQEAEKRDIPVVDGLTLVPHHPDYFAAECLHPNDRGFGAYACNLLPYLF